jgi:MscS family membrane protein
MSDGGVVFPGLTQEQAVQRAEDAVERASAGLRGALPHWALQRTLGLEVWQWLGIPLLVVVLLLVSLALAHLTEALGRRLARRTRTGTDDAVLVSVYAPLRLLWFSLLARVGLGVLSLPDLVEDGAQKLLRVLVSAAFFWALLRAAAVWVESFSGSDWAAARPGSRALVTLAARVARFALVGLGVLAVLSELGYSVSSVLAGLGLGGLALALGAQKTLEHVFGAFALAVDQPFREGDFVQAEGVMGTVERIGLRSTRIRTLERTLVTIPNGKLADQRLESQSARDRILLGTTLHLTWATTAAQLRAVRDAVEQRLQAEPLVVPGSAHVRFQQIGSSSLDLDVSAYVQVTDWEQFRLIREGLLFSFLELVEQAGTSLAYPTSTVRWERVRPASP